MKFLIFVIIATNPAILLLILCMDRMSFGELFDDAWCLIKDSKNE